MVDYQFPNSWSTGLAAAVGGATAGDSQVITVLSGSSVPVVTAGQELPAWLGNRANENTLEAVMITAHSSGSTSVTIRRGADLRTPFSHASSQGLFGPALWGSLLTTLLGSSTLSGTFRLTGVISPTALAANTNDWNPTGLATANVIRASASAAYTLTGLTAQESGRVIVLENVGSFAITLKDADTGSSAANRFDLASDYVLVPGALVLLKYDGTSSRWRSTPSLNGVIWQNFGSDLAQPVYVDVVGNFLSATYDAGTRTITLQQFDMVAADIASTPAGTLAANNVQSALNELDTEKAPLASPTFTGVVTSPAYAASGLTGATQASRYVGATASGAPASGTFAIGDFVIDRSGSLWVCTTAGTPGTWTEVSGGGGGAHDHNGDDLVPWSLTVDTTVQFKGDVTPAQITSNQNNYDADGSMSLATTLRLETDASRQITGFTGGLQGRLLKVINIGSFDIVLVDESASSTAANRFAMDGNLTLAAGQACDFIYDIGLDRWVLTGVGRTATGGGGSVATDAIWDAAGDLAVGSGANTAAKLTIGSALQALRVNAAGTDVAWIGVQGARVYHNANQSVANNSTATPLAFNAERFDTDGFHDTVTNNSRLTVPANLGGTYLMVGQVKYAANATGIRMAILQVNGTTTISRALEIAASGGATTETFAVSIYQLAAGDYVELVPYQNSGGALNVETAANYSPEFAIVRLG